MSETISMVRDIIVSASALIGAIVAMLGLKTWKDQITWKLNYELARRLLKATYKVRDSIRLVRNPFISIGEMKSARVEENLDEEDESLSGTDNETIRAVYKIRWGKLAENLSNFESELLEAQVSWGEQVIEAQKSLSQAIKKLHIHLMQLFESEEMRGKDMTDIRDVIYEMSDDPDKDEFTKQVKDAVTKIEIFLKPYLKV